MAHKYTRRETIKMFAAISVGTSFISWPFKATASIPVIAKPKINVKISPPGPKSLALIDEMKHYVGKTNYAGLYSIGLKDGEGIYIEDLDGNVYIDCLTSASSNILGYSHNEIADEYYNTSKRIQQTAFAYSPNIETVELAKKLVRIAPGDFPKRALIGLSGSDSAGGAIEAARKFTGKMGVISFTNAYHGSKR